MAKKHEKDTPFTFVLFPNPKHKEGDNLPHFVGKVIMEDGTPMRLAGWEKAMTNVDGNMIGGKMSHFLTPAQVEAKKKAAEHEPESNADDLPF